MWGLAPSAEEDATYTAGVFQVGTTSADATRALAVHGRLAADTKPLSAYEPGWRPRGISRWTGSPRFTYAWKRCTDVGSAIRFEVTATNDAGSTTATSGATRVIATAGG